MNVIRELRNFNAETTPLEDTIALAWVGHGIRDEFDKRGIEVPEWLDDCNRRLTRAIEFQTRDAKELRAKEIAAELARLKTPSERREELKLEQAKLDQELTGTTTGSSQK